MLLASYLSITLVVATDNIRLMPQICLRHSKTLHLQYIRISFFFSALFMAFIDSTKFRFAFSRLWSLTQTETDRRQTADDGVETDREQLPRTLPWPLLVACHSCLCCHLCYCCCSRCCLFIIICTESVRSGCAFFIAFL